jgi:hypothetical protein
MSKKVRGGKKFPGLGVMISKIFSPNKLEKNVPILSKKLFYAKKLP